MRRSAFVLVANRRTTMRSSTCLASLSGLIGSSNDNSAMRNLSQCKRAICGYKRGCLVPKNEETAIRQCSSAAKTMTASQSSHSLPYYGDKQYSPKRKRYAVLVDCDSAQSTAMELVIQELQSKFQAQIDVRRAYGDFSLQMMGKWRIVCSEQSFLPIHTFTFVKGKGTSDATLIMDAMELLYDTSNSRNNNNTPLDGFCIVSSDSDFTRLAQRLRESGKHVVGAGQGHTPDPFVQACDTFILVDELVKRQEPEQQQRRQAAALAKQGRQENVRLENETQRQEEQRKLGVYMSSFENLYLKINRLFGGGEKKGAIPPEKLYALHAVLLKHWLKNEYCNLSVISNTIQPELYGYDRISDLVADYPHDFEIMRDGSNSTYVKSLKNESMIQYDLSKVHRMIKELADGNGWACMGYVSLSSPVDVSVYGIKKLSHFLKRFPNEFEFKNEQSKFFVRSVSNGRLFSRLNWSCNQVFR